MDSLSLFSPDDNTPIKTCTGLCGRTLPATTEYFHRHSGNNLHPQCKECRLKRYKESYDNNSDVRERTIARAQARRDTPEGKAYQNAYNKEWGSRPGAKEYKRNYTRSYRTRPGVLESKHEWDREYNIRPEIREHRRPLERVWSSTRRARQRNVGGTYTHQQIEDLLKRQKHKCYYCQKKFEKNKDKYIYHIDHVIPLVRGGSNDISNLVLACPNCNQRKNDKMPHEWPDGGRLL